MFMKKALVGLIIGAGSVWLGLLGLSLYKTTFYRSALPAQIQVVGLATAHSDFNPILMFVPMRHEACGGAMFHLSEDAREEIKKGGLSSSIMRPTVGAIPKEIDATITTNMSHGRRRPCLIAGSAKGYGSDCIV